MTARNEPCPCGSGKKYKRCCYRKAFSYQEDANGTIRRSIPINDKLAWLLGKAVDELGPDAAQDDLLFPGIQAEQAEFEMVRAMEKTGIDPAIIYAFQETGMLISEENLEMFAQKDIDLWQSKIDEYNHRNKAEPMPFPIGTQALYGPDDKRTTKIVAAVILHENAEPILQRFVGSKVLEDPKVHETISQFFQEYAVKKVVITDGNIGCPHEEGEDYPVGSDCPFCPFWRKKN